MESVDRLVLTFLLNAAWQIPALLAAGALGARLLRRGPARHRHALWLGVLAACVLLPAASLLPREPAWRSSLDSTATVRTAESPMPAAWPAWVPLTAPETPRLPAAWVRAVALLYGLSFAAHAVRLGRAWRWTARLGRSARGVADADLPEPAATIAARCRAAFGLGPVPLCVSGAVDGPVTLGARVPAILLPPSLLKEAPADHLTAALGHEMAHIHRRDFLVNLLGELWLLPVAFHPATRWLRRRLAESREMACDEAAVERLIAPRVYARSLLSLATTFAGSSRPAYTLGALDADLLEVRMRRLLDAQPRLGARRARATLSLAALVLAAAGLTAAGLAFDPPSAGAAANDLAPFVGTWKGEYSELTIRDAGGQPEVALVWLRKSGRVTPRLFDPRVTGRTLRFRLQAEMQYRPDLPKQTVDFDQVFELTGDGPGQGRLRQIWSSLEGRSDVPPPPPPAVLTRQR